MQIIDAQIHLWSEGTVVPPHRTTPYLTDEALGDMDAAGITGAIIHPPSWDPRSNELAIAAAKAHPERFAILGRIPLDEPDKRSLIETWGASVVPSPSPDTNAGRTILQETPDSSGSLGIAISVYCTSTL